MTNQSEPTDPSAPTAPNHPGNRPERESLLASLDHQPTLDIFKDLAACDESKLGSILRPHDEVGFTLTWDKDVIRLRLRLDTAFDLLTRLEVGFEIGLLRPEDRLFVRRHLRPHFRQLVFCSSAFLRYASAYLYFGIRILAYRLFGPTWSNLLRPPLSDSPSGTPNRRFFPLAVPPLPVPPSLGDYHDLAAPFRAFCHFDPTPTCQKALNFLDGFSAYSKPDKPVLPRQGELSHDEQAAQFELWLRGLLPRDLPKQAQAAPPPSQLELQWNVPRQVQSEQQDQAGQQRQRELRKLTAQQQRQNRSFRIIRDGIVEWAKARTLFYLSLEPKPAHPDLSPSGKRAFRLQNDIFTNPLVARFALSDIYWLARILRADVSSGAGVSYSKLSWLRLIHFRSIYDDEPVARQKDLQDLEDTLRAVFDFVCDLIQNAADLTDQRQRRKFNPEDFPKPVRHLKDQPPTRGWRAVFDEELREIDRQRCSRNYGESSFKRNEPLPENAWDTDRYWSERLITGRQPYNRIGLAFSGGGVRSATFNLGVLQGLQEFDLLRHIDYLSCVSGGGFIGAWLVGNVQRTRTWLGRATCWDESVAHLRSYASYLAPITGILSADTWTLGATWLRNAFLIQVTGLAWLFALLLADLGLRMIFCLPAATNLLAGPSLTSQWSSLTTHSIPPAALVSLIAGLFITSSLAYNFQDNRVETGKHAPSARWVQLLSVLPSWIGGFLVAAILWSLAPLWLASSPGNPHLRDYSFILQHLWQWIFVLLAFYFLSLLIIGWFALQPSVPFVAGKLNLVSPALQRKLEAIWRSLWIGSLCVAVLYLALSAILYLNLQWMSDPTRFESYAFVFEPALVVSAYTLSVFVFIGLSGRRSNEAQREWWTRFGAWTTIYAVAGLALAAAAVFGPTLTLTLFSQARNKWIASIKWGAVFTWLGTILAGLLAGNSSKTAGPDASGKSLALELLAKAGGLAFVLAALLASSTLLYELLRNIATNDGASVSYWLVLHSIALIPFAAVCLVVLLCGLLFSWFFEINIFGLSQFYRNRLVRAYLGATRWTPGLRKPQPFTKFDFKDDMPLSALTQGFRGPFPIFNCTLNLAGSSDLSIRTRHSASFSLTPLRCGADRPKVGYAPTVDTSPSVQDLDPSLRSFAGGVMLGQAVAISGAAASPNMGYNTSPLVALLLTMFNVRLGWWFPNPLKKYWKARGLRFGLSYLARELVGMADENQDFLNVSDGGHFENLGVYELLRRRCKVIIAADAECDEVLQFPALGNLVRIAATDFGATIELDVRSIQQQKDGHSLAHCAVGKIKYSNGSIGTLIYLKSSITGDEDIGIIQYRSTHPSFPHETTANQFFSEDQFESYRKLGRHIVCNSFRGNQPGTTPTTVAEKLADVMVSARTSGEAFLKHTRTLDRIWDEFRRSPALHSFIDELMNIRPPVAVFPPTPANPHQASEELCMALQLIQLMEDVFMDLQLEDFWDHPDNRGWAILFMRWARSPRFQAFWTQTRRTFGIRFEYFCEARLGLQRDHPIVRV